jgi:transcriptional regulator with XRE-family HTH domain
MEEYKELIGRKIKYLREKNNITQQFLADQIDGMTVQMVCAYEKGKQYPSLKNLINFSKYFKVPLDFFCSEDFNGVYNEKKIMYYSDIVDSLVTFYSMEAVSLYDGTEDLQEYCFLIKFSKDYDIDFLHDVKTICEIKGKIDDELFESLVESIKKKYRNKHLILSEYFED